ncbi:SpoIID/LytB domain-containing protein [Raphidiopsis sp. BLCC-F218]
MKNQLHLNTLLNSLSPHHWSRNWWTAIILWFAFITPAPASVILRIAIEKEVEQIKVGASTTAVVRDGSGRNLGELTGSNSYAAQSIPGGVALDKWQSGLFWIEPTAKGYVYIGDRWFRGRTLIVPTGKGITAVNWVDLEEYLYSVVGGEMSSSWHEEALKAQAIAARTYALYKRKEQRNNPLYDLGDSPDSWQVYHGVSSESPRTYSAVDETAGQVLTYKNQIILSAFHACSGGHTENVEDVWGNPLPYLRAVQDFDQNVRDCNWNTTFSSEQISARVPGVGNVKEIMIESLSPFRSVKTLRIVGDQGSKVLKGEEVRTILKLRSTRFTVNKDVNGNFVLQGLGFGHGLGMSQWGAYILAKNGFNHLQILGYYYKGVALTPIKAK